MQPFPQQQLLLSLIKDDLIHHKLVHGLIDMGLDASPFFINLGHTVFELMGFEDSLANDEVFEHYQELCRAVRCIDMQQPYPALDLLSVDIYGKLQSLLPQHTGAPCAAPFNIDCEN